MLPSTIKTYLFYSFVNRIGFFFLVNEGDTTFIVLEGSYKYHNDFTKEFEETSPDDWFLLNQEQIKWYIDAKKCIKKIIKCSAGSLVLRDS